MDNRVLDQLIDYAGLFPPAQLTMAQAVDEYDRSRAGAESHLLGRFIVPAARLAELRSAVAGRVPFELSVIAAIDAFGAAAREREAGWAAIAVLEVPLGERSIDELVAAADAQGLRDLPIYVEGTRDFAALSRAGLRAKLRCGGLEPAMFPSPHAVASFIAGASAAGVPFKATAGLHHPIRRYNERARVTMHGFLNLLAATSRAPHAGTAELEAIVAEEDARRVLRLLDDDAAAVRARERFVGYGSCSFEEPVDDLRHLKILHAAH